MSGGAYMHRIENVFVAGHILFPSGSASAARIRNLATGFQENGIGVHVVAMAPDKASARQGQLPGYPAITYQNVALFSASIQGRTNPRQAALGRLRWFLGLYGAVFPGQRQLAERIRKGQCDLFIGYGRNAFLLAPLVRLCRRHKIPAVLDVTEIPEQFSGWGGKLNPIFWDTKLGTEWLPQYFNTISVITFGLQEKYERLGCSSTLVIPSIEGWADLPPVAPLPKRNAFRLVYVGALIERDAPDLLFAAMRLLHERGVPITLEIVGRYSLNAQGRQMVDQVNADPVLRASINLVGMLSDDELVAYLRDADGLILMRRDAPTEVNAFPTRLVEYLKHGRPVFISDVGDIGRYLRNGVDAMLLSPTDPNHVAAAIQSVAESSDRGFALGVQGRGRGAAMFDRRIHVRRLLDFVAEHVATASNK